MSEPVQQVFIASATWQGDTAQVQAMDQAISGHASNTHALLNTWQALGHSFVPPEDDWATPLERAWAHALGWRADKAQALLDQPLPLAALELQQQLPYNTPAAWLSPVHFLAGMNDVRLSHPNHLQLSAHTSQALMAALKPLCDEDGVTLSYVSPNQWLVVGERLRGIVSPSIWCAADQAIDAWLPFSASHPEAAKWMRRLQNEAQMLFYTHPAHEQRRALGLQAISGLWLHGAGAMAQPVAHPMTQPTAHAPAVQLVTSLAEQAHLPFEWQTAWAAMDTSTIKELLAKGHTQAIELHFASHNGLTSFASPALAASRPAPKWQLGALLSGIKRLVGSSFKADNKTLPSALMP